MISDPTKYFLGEKMSKKKLTKGLAVALVASHLLTGVACNSKDNERGNNKGDTTPISGETGSFDSSIMLEDVEFESSNRKQIKGARLFSLTSFICFREISNTYVYLVKQTSIFYFL